MLLLGYSRQSFDVYPCVSATQTFNRVIGLHAGKYAIHIEGVSNTNQSISSDIEAYCLFATTLLPILLGLGIVFSSLTSTSIHKQYFFDGS